MDSGVVDVREPGLLQDSSKADLARARVQKIRAHVEDVKALIIEAYEGRDWETLRYATWDDYCTAEFGAAIAIPKDERAELVFHLRDHGLSLRAIESATGISKATAARTLASGVPSETPAKTTGTDGKKYKPNRGRPVKVILGKPEDDINVFPELVSVRTTPSETAAEPLVSPGERDHVIVGAVPQIAAMFDEIREDLGCPKELWEELLAAVKSGVDSEKIHIVDNHVVIDGREQGALLVDVESRPAKKTYEYRLLWRWSTSRNPQRMVFKTLAAARKKAADVKSKSGTFVVVSDVVIERREVGPWEEF